MKNELVDRAGNRAPYIPQQRRQGLLIHLITVRAALGRNNPLACKVCRTGILSVAVNKMIET